MNQEIPKGRHGGYRPGSGRKKGTGTKPASLSQQAREFAKQATVRVNVESGGTPLDVMVGAMNAMLSEAAVADKAKDLKGKLTLLAAASNIAKDAAPYVHPRLAAISHSLSPDSIRVLNEAERASRLAAIATLARDREAAALEAEEVVQRAKIGVVSDPPPNGATTSSP